MLDASDAAKQQLKDIAAQRQLDPGKFLRLAVPPVWTGDGDFGIVVDDRGAMDTVVKLEGHTVLLIEREVANQMSKSVLDYKVTPQGMGFTLDVY
jgi:Fe-S cluster assembly iron-binding protein IscA